MPKAFAIQRMAPSCRRLTKSSNTAPASGVKRITDSRWWYERSSPAKRKTVKKAKRPSTMTSA
jgi:hypothetical protein